MFNNTFKQQKFGATEKERMSTVDEAFKKFNEALEKYEIDTPEVLVASQALDPYIVIEQKKRLSKS